MGGDGVLFNVVHLKIKIKQIKEEDTSRGDGGGAEGVYKEARHPPFALLIRQNSSMTGQSIANQSVSVIRCALDLWASRIEKNIGNKIFIVSVANRCKISAFLSRRAF